MTTPHKPGFTLIELLVTIVIIGILSAISVASFSNYQEKARLAKASSFSNNIIKLANATITANEGEDSDNLFGYYSFEGNTINSSSAPYITDMSISGNNFDSSSGSGSFSQSSDTPTGKGSSLNIQSQTLSRSQSFFSSDHEKLTLSFWLKPDSDFTNGRPISMPGCLISLDRGRIVFSSPGGYLASDFDTIKNDEWQHILATFEFDNSWPGQKNAYLYVNGEIIKQTELTGPFWPGAWTQGYGFSLGGGASYLFDGLIDDLVTAPYFFNGETME